MTTLLWTSGRSPIGEEFRTGYLGPYPIATLGPNPHSQHKADAVPFFGVIKFFGETISIPGYSLDEVQKKTEGRLAACLQRAGLFRGNWKREH